MKARGDIAHFGLSGIESSQMVPHTFSILSIRTLSFHDIRGSQSKYCFSVDCLDSSPWNCVQKSDDMFTEKGSFLSYASVLYQVSYVFLV